jgi:hypothetical protein
MKQLRSIACLLALLSAGSVVNGQAPDLSQAAELWRGSVEGRPMRVLQVPRRATALIPLRILLQELELHSHAPEATACAGCAGGVHEPAAGGGTGRLLDRYEHAAFMATAGAEATLSYNPKRLPVQFWGTDLAEVRETFRSPGTYQVTFGAAQEPSLRLAVPIEVQAFAYLPFGQEFGLFVLGCLLLAGLFLPIIVWLHRRMTPSSLPASTQSLHPAETS